MTEELSMTQHQISITLWDKSLPTLWVRKPIGMVGNNDHIKDHWT